jgi:hypothetical protein
MIYLSKLNAGLLLLTRQLFSGRVIIIINISWAGQALLGFLFVNLYFYIFIHSPHSVGIPGRPAMNSSPAAKPCPLCTILGQHSVTLKLYEI